MRFQLGLNRHAFDTFHLAWQMTDKRPLFVFLLRISRISTMV